MNLTALALAAALGAPVAPAVPVVLTAVPDRVSVVGLPCFPGSFQVGLTNTGSTDRFADVELTPRAPVVLDRRVISTWLPARDPDQTVSTVVGVSVPRSAVPGVYPVVLSAGRSRVTVPVEVRALPPKGPGANLAVGELASASSTHGSFKVCGGVDGDADSANWSVSTGWNDGTRAVFPDDYSVLLRAPSVVSRVEVQTLDSERYPAAVNGIRDFDVQLRSGGTWSTVDTIRGNISGRTVSTFTPVTADAVRVVVRDSNDHAYSRIVELEVY